VLRGYLHIHGGQLVLLFHPADLGHILPWGLFLLV
jgi:hypothetical protein